MGQHLGKKETPVDFRAPSPEASVEPAAAAAAAAAVEPTASASTASAVEQTVSAAAASASEADAETQDEVFGLSEADAEQNNGGVSSTPAVTDSTGAAAGVEGGPWPPASTADADAAGPRPHLARLFSRDAPGREDNTFKERPSESDELQTIQEHSGAASECGSESPEQDLD